MGDTRMETYFGFVSTSEDALALFEACRLGYKKRVPRRLSDAERAAIRSGSVFVWEEGESGMKRWTDGRSWSPSRVQGCFLTYHEWEGRRRAQRHPSYHTMQSFNLSMISSTMNIQGIPSQTIPMGIARYGHFTGGPTKAGSSQVQYGFPKENGMLKKALSIRTRDGKRLHIIAYYSKEDHAQRRLLTPSTDPDFPKLPVPQNLYPDMSPESMYGASHHSITSSVAANTSSVPSVSMSDPSNPHENRNAMSAPTAMGGVSSSPENRLSSSSISLPVPDAVDVVVGNGGPMMVDGEYMDTRSRSDSNPIEFFTHKRDASSYQHFGARIASARTTDNGIVNRVHSGGEHLYYNGSSHGPNTAATALDHHINYKEDGSGGNNMLIHDSPPPYNPFTAHQHPHDIQMSDANSANNNRYYQSAKTRVQSLVDESIPPSSAFTPAPSTMQSSSKTSMMMPPLSAPSALPFGNNGNNNGSAEQLMESSPFQKSHHMTSLPRSNTASKYHSFSSSNGSIGMRPSSNSFSAGSQFNSVSSYHTRFNQHNQQGQFDHSLLSSTVVSSSGISSAPHSSSLHKQPPLSSSSSSSSCHSTGNGNYTSANAAPDNSVNGRSSGGRYPGGMCSLGLGMGASGSRRSAGVRSATAIGVVSHGRGSLPPPIQNLSIEDNSDTSTKGSRCSPAFQSYKRDRSSPFDVPTNVIPASPPLHTASSNNGSSTTSSISVAAIRCDFKEGPRRLPSISAHLRQVTPPDSCGDDYPGLGISNNSNGRLAVPPLPSPLPTPRESSRRFEEGALQARASFPDSLSLLANAADRVQGQRRVSSSRSMLGIHPYARSSNTRKTSRSVSLKQSEDIRQLGVLDQSLKLK